MLAALDDTARDGLLNRGRRRVFETGEALVVQGEQSAHVLVLLDGYVKVTAVGRQGTTTFLAIRAGGDLIGELAAVDRAPRLATVTAGGSVIARLLSQSQFHGFLAEHPAAALTVSSYIAAKLRRATGKLVDFNGREVLVRVARVLAELAANYGQHTPEGVELRISLTQPELAGLVSASEPSVQKALAVLRKDGVVATSYRNLRIQDLAALHAMADGPDGPGGHGGD
ncbi:cAMP receptor protein [Streptomonospora litoralis]|uniref:cAMP receptor protein n=1 Tax=Streptomonospora litoralis TaxID=2498135 RepID=A0A4P6PZ75_9ACTN|nr:cAMP receptor protein [Streptomonospora litoralis]